MKRPWAHLPVGDRMELLRSYRKAGYSYRDAMGDFSNTLKSYEDGGVVEEPMVQRPINNMMQNNMQFAQPQTQQSSTFIPQQLPQRQEVDYVNQDKLNLMQRYLQGDTLADTEMNEKYGTSVHRFRYDNDPNYAQKVNDASKYLAKQSGSINLPHTDLRRGDNTPPVLQFMYPQLQGKAQRAMSEFSTNVMSIPTPLPGFQALGKIPNLSKGLKYVSKELGEYLTTKTPLKYAHNLNPQAFKPATKMMYRGLGEDGMRDALESGVFRPKQYPKPVGEGNLDIMNTTKSFDKTYYAPGEKFKVVESYDPSYIAEVPKDAAIFRNRYSKGKDWSQLTEEQIPIEKGTIYKKDWWKRYEKIKQQSVSKTVNTTDKVDDVGKSFKSEIDWAKWNKEIPENKSLMREYNAIEQTAKAKGTWMKNPDGSVFQGTPEQFVQQHSENFKKYFRNSDITDYYGNPQIVHNSSFDDFSVFNPNASTIDKNFYFTNSLNKSKGYGDNTRSVYLSDPSINQSLDPTEYTYGIMNRKAYGYKGKDVNIDIMQGGDEFITKNPHVIKSAIGNNGMFDMTNPDIYKGLITPIVGGALLQNQRGRKKQEYVPEF